MKESKSRSIAKGVSWRFFGTLNTILIAYFIIGDVSQALSIGGIEIVTKLILFYIHERLWIWGYKNKKETHAISLIKSITWRIMGTIDTMVISFFVINSGGRGESNTMLTKAGIIGILEFFSKIVLFYIHERVWLRIPFWEITPGRRGASSKIRDRFKTPT